MEEQYNNWNNIKKEIANDNITIGFKNRDIFYMNMGKNGRCIFSRGSIKYVLYYMFIFVIIGL